LKIGFIGDVVGRPGRAMIKSHVSQLRSEHNLDFVIANYENASHGFGLTMKNAKELFNSGVDAMTGGNHSFDKKEILPLFDTMELLRPHNYPSEVPGTGLKVYEVEGEKLAILNLMGHFSMPYVDNMFRCAKEVVASLHVEGISSIFIDVHAEATSEKRALFKMFEGQVSAIVGTHTHVSTDDFQISKGSAYLSDIGLTGCRDNVIGMDEKVPIEKFLTGMGRHFEIPSNCKSILQMAIVELDEGKCVDAYKVKVYDNGDKVQSSAYKEL